MFADGGPHHGGAATPWPAYANLAMEETAGGVWVRVRTLWGFTALVLIVSTISRYSQTCERVKTPFAVPCNFKELNSLSKAHIKRGVMCLWQPFYRIRPNQYFHGQRPTELFRTRLYANPA